MKLRPPLLLLPLLPPPKPSPLRLLLLPLLPLPMPSPLKALPLRPPPLLPLPRLAPPPRTLPLLLPLPRRSNSSPGEEKANLRVGFFYVLTDGMPSDQHTQKTPDMPAFFCFR